MARHRPASSRSLRAPYITPTGRASTRNLPHVKCCSRSRSTRPRSPCIHRCPRARDRCIRRSVPAPAIVRTRHHGRCDVPPRSQQVSGTPYDTSGVLCSPRGRTCVMMLSLLKMPFVGRWRRHKHCHLSPPSRPLHRPEQRRAAPRLSGPLAHDVIITVNGEYRPERAICGHSAPWEPIKHAPRLHMLLTLITPCTPATCVRVFHPPPAAPSRSPSSLQPLRRAGRAA